MPIDETIVTGKKFRVWDAVLNKWKRMSYWTKASDVELDNGENVEDKVSEINTNLAEIWSGQSPLKTTTFPSDGSILDTFSQTESLRTVFNTDGSISEIFTSGSMVIEHKTIFNSDGSISVVDVPQT